MLDRRAKLTIALLSMGHFSADAYSSFLLPMLPVLAVKLRLTPARAGILVPTLMVTSSLCQPLYGLVSDRYLKRSMSVFGPLIAACFISSIGLVTSLPALIAIIVLGGLGIGAFHPQSAAIVSRVSRRQSAAAMSIFSSAGPSVSLSDQCSLPASWLFSALSAATTRQCWESLSGFCC
jgi:FSR family fosmidomycin resistance protein-like MFS transporter